MTRRIKQLLSALNLRCEDFAATIGVTGGAVRMWMCGKANVSTKNRRAIIRAYGVNPDWLIDGRGEMFESGRRATKPHLRMAVDGSLRQESATIYLRLSPLLKRRVETRATKAGVPLNKYVISCLEGES